MSWEGFGIFLGIFLLGPLVIATILVVSVVSALCAIPIGVAWALAAILRPQIVGRRGKSRVLDSSLPPPPPTPSPGARDVDR